MTDTGQMAIKKKTIFSINFLYYFQEISPNMIVFEECMKQMNFWYCIKSCTYIKQACIQFFTTNICIFVYEKPYDHMMVSSPRPPLSTTLAIIYKPLFNTFFSSLLCNNLLNSFPKEELTAAPLKLVGFSRLPDQ